MFVIKARTNIADVVKAFGVAESQLPFAVAKALTKTGQQVKAAEEGEIARSFENPTPFTKRSVFLQVATKTRQQARVWLKDSGKDAHYLLPQIEGGDRPMKRFEQRLRMTGYMSASERAVPGEAVQLDAYGNVSRGMVNKILSQLRTAVVQGDYSNASGSRRSRAKRSVVEYFVSKGPGSERKGWAHAKRVAFGQHLPRGIWERRVHAWGTSVRPVFLFVSATKYSRRYDFFGVAQATVDRHLVPNAEAAVADAMRTARFSVQGRLL